MFGKCIFIATYRLYIVYAGIVYAGCQAGI